MSEVKWTLIEHEQSGLIMVPLCQAERELREARTAASGWFRAWETADKNRIALLARVVELEYALKETKKEKI